MRLFAALLLLSTACSMLATSPETATRDMRLYVTVDSSDAGTHVDATLTGPFGDPDLGPSDSFSLFVDGAPTPFSAWTSSRWIADLVARSGELAFVLHHEGDHDVKSIATLPPPSGIHGASSGGKLVVDWTPTLVSGVTTTLTVTGKCIEPQSITIRTDTGHYELVAAQLQALPSSCTLTVGLSRASDVTNAPFGEAFMDAKVTQSESAEIAWAP